MSTLIPVPVPGATEPLMATEADGKAWASVRHVCEAIGINHAKQQQKLKGKKWAVVYLRDTTAADGKVYKTTMVDRRTLTMWLATIDANRVNDAARPVLEAFQAEAADALDAYFHEGGAINPNATEDQLGRLHTTISIAREQAEVLRILDGLMDPKHLEAKARIVAARALGETPELVPADVPLYAEDYLKQLGLPAKWIKHNRGVFGRRLKAAYVEAHGAEPGDGAGEVGGRTLRIAAYTESDRALMDRVFDTYYGELFPEVSVGVGKQDAGAA